ncbi:MAG TPA: hypothetical protein VHX92_08555 [Rhizomicrobium sp.]|nr:hypothetical protein [Rhizomicrobium sp.]
MIDRNAFRISGLFLLIMVAATVWRLSLLPDWRHMPVGGGHTITGLVLFAAPLSLLITMVVPYLPKLLMSDVGDSKQAWGRWNGRWIVSQGAIIFALQVIVLIHSLGVLPLPAEMIVRVTVVLMGLMFMTMGNIIPKAPSMPAGADPRALNPWQQSRQMRLIGKLLFGLGLLLAIGGMLLPPEFLRSAFLYFGLAALAAGIWYGVKLRREPARLP